MNTPLSLQFPNGKLAYVSNVHAFEDLPSSLQEMGLQDYRPTLVVIGGASNMTPEHLDCLNQLFVDVLAPVAETQRAFVVDGGTDAGIMRMMGRAHSFLEATFPLVGVAPAQKVDCGTPPGDLSGEALEFNHTHFVLTPGTAWGDESPWIARTASELSGPYPSVAVLINGGQVALIDVIENVKAGRPVVVLEGSGRLADTIAMAVHDPEADVPESIRQLLKTGQIMLFNLAQPSAQLATILRTHLSSKS